MDQSVTTIIKAVAIDDEPIALDIIQRHADVTSGITLINKFISCSDALDYLKQEKVDLIFLDITMPDMSGLEFASLVNPEILIVFTTAHPEYAVTGFDLAVTDYLLKPISLSRFSLAVERALDRITRRTTISSLFVKDGYSLVQINLHELLFVESDGNYVTFFEKTKKTVSRMKLTGVLEKLPSNRFLRIHKCYLINKEKIDRIDGKNVIVAGQRLPISTRYHKELIKELVR